MGNKLGKNQNSSRGLEKETGVIIDCDEITISVFPPPREHGNAHCHVKKKTPKKHKGKEIFPEVKVFLGGSDVIIITEGFSERDLNIIGEIIFNDPEEENADEGQTEEDKAEDKEKEISNDEYLLTIWEELHNGEP